MVREYPVRYAVTYVNTETKTFIEVVPEMDIRDAIRQQREVAKLPTVDYTPFILASLDDKLAAYYAVAAVHYLTAGIDLERLYDLTDDQICAWFDNCVEKRTVLPLPLPQEPEPRQPPVPAAPQAAA